jgi:WD40 repeat protein
MVALNDRALKSKPGAIKVFVSQLLTQVQLSHNLLTSLLSLPPSLYVVDAVLSRMSPQLKSQAEIRYLISVASSASPAVLFRFGFVYAASSNLTVSSLALVFIQRLKQLVHPVDFRLLIPPKVEKDLVHITPSPDPVNDTLLETLQGLVAEELPHSLITPSEKSIAREPILISKQISWEAHEKVSDFDFLPDGRTYLAACGSTLRLFQLGTGSPERRIGCRSPIDKIAVCSTSIVVASTCGGTTYFDERPLDPNLHDTSGYSLTELGRVTTMVKSPVTDTILIGTAEGHVIFHTRMQHFNMLRLQTDLGAVSSIAFVPQTSYYTVGTAHGIVLLYDFRMQCPCRRMRLSDRPAMMAAGDPDSFWITCGPHVVKTPIPMNRIDRRFSVAQTHAIQCCCVKDWVVTAHTDHSVFAFNGKSVLNLSPPPVIQTVDDPFVTIPPATGGAVHTAPITMLKSSPVTCAPVSCDESGKVVFWPIPCQK